MTVRRLRAARLLLAILLTAAPLILVPSLYDAANLPQTVVIDLGALVLGTLWLRDGAPGAGAPRSSLDVPLALLLGWSWASLLWATNRFETMNTLVHWSACGLIFLVVSRLSWSEAEAALVVRGLLVSATCVSVLGLAQQLLGLDLVPQASPPAATFVSRNVAAQFTAAAVPACLALFVWTASSLEAWLSAVAAAVIAAFLLHTSVRSAWLAALVTLAFAAFAAARRPRGVIRLLRQRPRPAAATAAVALFAALAHSPGAGLPSESPALLLRQAVNGAILAAPPNAAGPLASPEPRATRSVGLRLEVWSDTLRIIRDGAFVGAGLGNLRVVYPRFASRHGRIAGSSELQPEATHNDYLQITAELGVPGLVLVLWLGLALIGRVLSLLSRSQPGGTRILVLGMTLSLTALAVDACFSFPMERAVPPLVCAAFGGLLVALGTPAPLDGALVEQERVVPRASLAAAVAAMLGVTVWGAVQLVADGHVLRQVRAERRGEWDAAIREGERALAWNPFRTAPLFAVGAAYLRLGQYAAAARALEKVVRAYPHYSNAIGNLGMAHLESGAADAALRCFDRVLQARPDDPLAHYGRGLVLERQGFTRDALFELRRAAAGDPSQAWFQYRLGVVAFELGLVDEALVALRRAVDRSPGWIAPKAKLAEALTIRSSALGVGRGSAREAERRE